MANAKKPRAQYVTLPKLATDYFETCVIGCHPGDRSEKEAFLCALWTPKGFAMPALADGLLQSLAVGEIIAALTALANDCDDYAENADEDDVYTRNEYRLACKGFTSAAERARSFR